MTEFICYRLGDRVPVLDWLKEIKALDYQGYVNGLGRLRQLEADGYRLRFPAAEPLGDGMYVLRWKHQTMQYRLFYFFDKHRAVLAHGFNKKSRDIPNSEKDMASKRKTQFTNTPHNHSFDFLWKDWVQ